MKPPVRAGAHNILIVTQDFPPVTGGIQTYVHALALHFHARGHAVTVVCPGRDDMDAGLPSGIRVLRVRIHTSWLFLPMLFRLPGLLRKGGYTRVLYGQWQCALSELFIPRRQRRHRAVCLVHGRETLRSIFGPLHRFFCRLAFTRVDVGIPNSRAVEALTRRAASPRCPLRLVHPAVDPGFFVPGDAATARAALGVTGDPVVLAMARMVPRKNMDGVLRAFPAVLREFPGAALVLAGDGPERERLVQLAVRLGCADRVVFPGVVRHKEFVGRHGVSAYAAADVFVMPCHGSPRDVEGFGIVYLEAGACEVPVVGSRVGGIPDAVEEGVTGLLVDPARPGELEEALLRILRMPDRGRSMGVAARARILRSLTWEATGDAILDAMGAPDAT